MKEGGGIRREKKNQVLRVYEPPRRRIKESIFLITV